MVDRRKTICKTRMVLENNDRMCIYSVRWQNIAHPTLSCRICRFLIRLQSSLNHPCLLVDLINSLHRRNTLIQIDPMLRLFTPDLAHERLDLVPICTPPRLRPWAPLRTERIVLLGERQARLLRMDGYLVGDVCEWETATRKQVKLARDCMKIVLAFSFTRRTS